MQSKGAGLTAISSTISLCQFNRKKDEEGKESQIFFPLRNAPKKKKQPTNFEMKDQSSSC